MAGAFPWPRGVVSPMRCTFRNLLVIALAAWLTVPPGLAAESSIAVLQIKIIEGEGAVHEAGSRSSRPLVVQVTDETGRPVPGATVSFRMPTKGPKGFFGSGLPTDVLVTGVDGRVALWGLRWDREQGSVRIRITAAKGDARAGTVSEQYIATRKTSAKAEPMPRPKSTSKPKGKWIVIALAAAGAAAGGLVLGLSGKSATLPPAATTAPPVQVGAPTITIGAP